MSEDLKPPFKQHAQFVRDLLSEYETYSEGKLKLEVVKIGEGDSKKEEEAQKYKVQKSNRGVVSANKFEIGSTFLGVGFDYHGEIESIPIIENDAGLEFEISGLIKQMTVKKRKIAFASSEGELTPAVAMAAVCRSSPSSSRRPATRRPPSSSRRPFRPMSMRC